MELPSHYRAFYRLFIRFALVLLVVGGFAGILYVEMTRSLSFAEVEPGRRLETTYRLAILHGHSFLVGAVIPMIWVFILDLVRRLGHPPVGPKALAWVTWTYLPGAVSVLFLIGYKGVHYVTRVKAGETDFDRIHASLFGGSRLASGLAHGIGHTVATLGLIIFAVVVFRSLAKPVEASQ